MCFITVPGGVARYPPFFGQGRGKIYLDDVQCNGTEAKLVECTRGGLWAKHNCYHREDAGVECYNRNNGMIYNDTYIISLHSNMSSTTPVNEHTHNKQD